MSVVSIRLPEQMLHQVDFFAQELHMPRNQYIREALLMMNKTVALQQRKEKLAQASLRTRTESMKINTEFSEIEHDPESS